MGPIYINHEATEPPLDHYSRQDVDLALARLEQRMTHYIDTTHVYLATRLDSITSSCANIEKKVDKIDPTTSKLNNGNKRTADDAFGNFNGACKDLGGAVGRLDEAVARLSASTDALAARFGVPRKKDEEADVYEWEKDDCVVKFA